MKPATETQLLAVLLGIAYTGELAAQTTLFTYQGDLRDNGQPASGIYDLRFTIYDAAGGGNSVDNPLTNAATTVSGGLFTVALDFGLSVFTGANRWLEIGVRDGGSTGSFEVLGARQPLTPTPYALHAYSVIASNVNGVLPDATIPNSVVRTSGPQIIHGPVRFEDLVEFAGGDGGPPFSLTYLDILPGLNAAMLGDRTAEGFWQTGGNADTTPGADFLGTSDNQPLELKVNGLRALHLVPTGDGATDQDNIPDGAPNFIGGSPANLVAGGVVGATISGGGATNLDGSPKPNTIAADYATIGGGGGNVIASNASFGTISGGGINRIETNVWWALIGGGGLNTIETEASRATVAGGYANIIQRAAYGASVGGGLGNLIASNASLGTISGGYDNRIQPEARGAVIGGGEGNRIEAGAPYTTVNGGWGNVVVSNAPHGTISGGGDNRIESNAALATIGGGFGNRVIATSGVIGGGGGVTSLDGNLVSDEGGFVGGGGRNHAGNTNEIRTDAYYATVTGGWNNQAGGKYSAVPGGLENRSLGDLSFAAGRRAKANHRGAFVWADSDDTDFPSSGPNQFLIRAAGGVGINTTNPAAALDVRVLGSEAASVHVGGEGANGLGKLVYFGDIPYVSIGEQGVDNQMVLTAGSFYFDNKSGPGGVGLGRFATANKLEVEGDASKTTAGSWLANSDRRIKRDIRPLTNALETLAHVRPVSFRYTEAYRAAHPDIVDRDYVNVVAQEFADVFPDYVKGSGEPSPEGGGEEIRQVDSYPLLIYGTAAIQELNRKVELRSQQAAVRTQALRAENAALKARLERLEQFIAHQFAKGPLP